MYLFLTKKIDKRKEKKVMQYIKREKKKQWILCQYIKEG
jgi:hypothetical protein